MRTFLMLTGITLLSLFVAIVTPIGLTFATSQTSTIGVGQAGFPKLGCGSVIAAQTGREVNCYNNLGLNQSHAVARSNKKPDSRYFFVYEGDWNSFAFGVSCPLTGELYDCRAGILIRK